MGTLSKVRYGAFAWLLLTAGCTAISGASDYEVDPSTVVRDLDYSFAGMVPHANVTLDVAVVDENKLLQARARIILPPPVTDYPTEELVLRNGLTPGEQTLYFFADNDGDGLVGGSKDKIVEHIWVEKVDPNGIGEFTHNTNFIYFNEKSYTPLNGALVLELPELAKSEEPTPAERAFLTCLDRKLGKQLEVTLTLVEQDREVGLFRRYAGTPYPESVRLNGVLDGGSLYKIEVRVDGIVKKAFERAAPAEDDLVIRTAEWFPVTVTECMKGE